LIDDLLDSARITSGKLHIDRRETDLREVLREAIEAVAPAAEAKGVALEVNASEAAPAWVDAGRIRQVIWNLVNNAVKFTPEGGLGLGLAISRHLVELHGGTITAESAGAGKGATFTVRLPLPHLRSTRRPRREDDPTAATPVAAAPRAESRAPLGGVRVLLVE